MPDLIVLVPSRGRPEAMAELANAMAETCTADTWLVPALDDNDPTRADYLTIGRQRIDPKFQNSVSEPLAYPSRTMVEALNFAADYAVGWKPQGIAFFGDDHRPRTKGWDTRYLDALRTLGTGIVYGNDLLQGRNLPTQCAMTADIIRTLGYMAPPGLTHLAVDNFWLALGRGAGCIKYLPDVTVEHMHPLVGKQPWTEGHVRVNAPEMYDRDLAEWRRFHREELDDAVAKVRALRA